MRSYINVSFQYNLADLQRTSPSTAKLPLIVEWETARETGRISDTDHLEKVANRWYIKDFDFVTFPVVFDRTLSAPGVAFAVVILYFCWRSKKRRHPRADSVESSADTWVDWTPFPENQKQAHRYEHQD